MNCLSRSIHLLQEAFEHRFRLLQAEQLQTQLPDQRHKRSNLAKQRVTCSQAKVSTSQGQRS